MNPEWRDIPSWEGIYQVSDNGQVRRIGGRPRRRGARDGMVSGKPHPRGYVMVALREKPRTEYWLVHRLVMLAFVGASKDGHALEVNHKNGDKADNRLENLEYVTSAQNKQHASDVLGNGRGERNANAKLTPAQVDEIRGLSRSGVTGVALATRFGISQAQVSRIVNGTRWRGNPAANPWREEFPAARS